MAACPFCAGSSKPFVQAFGDDLHRCRGCGLVFLWPPPDSAEMVRRHLSEEYAAHPYFQAGEEAASTDGLAIHERVLHALRQHVAAGGRVLDVGAGAGDFLLQAAGAGFTPVGVEPSPHLAKRIRQRLECPLFVGPFEQYQQPASCAAVLLMDVIEHAADPRAMLRHAYDTLQPGGMLFVCTVDSNCLLYRLAPAVAALGPIVMKAAYVLKRIFCYQHNWYFNRRVLSRLVEQAGFRVLEHRGYEFPLGRLRESRWIKLGLRGLYLAHALLGPKTEQYLIARKPPAQVGRRPSARPAA